MGGSPQERDAPLVGSLGVLDGTGCDRVIRSDVVLGFGCEGGGDLLSSRAASSAMAPEPVFPSPPSDGGLLGGEEVTRDEILGVILKGGKVWYYHCPGRRGWRVWLS